MRLICLLSAAWLLFSSSCPCAADELTALCDSARVQGEDHCEAGEEPMVKMSARWFLENPRKFWVRILVFAAVLYILWCISLYLVQDNVIFPRKMIPSVTIAPPEGTIEVWITGDKGERVQGWYLPPLKRSRGPAPVVIFFHGNGELIDFWGDEFTEFRKRGIGVLLPEFRGYGRSGGSPGQRDIAADMRKFYQWLLARPDVDGKKIVYFGRSLGGGVACQLAKDHAPAALILQSTFVSLKEMSGRFLVPSFLLKHPFDNGKVVADLRCPICIIHGQWDTVIPVVHGRRLHQIAPNSAYHEVASGHNDMPMDAAYWQTIFEFLIANGILDPDKH